MHRSEMSLRDEALSVRRVSRLFSCRLFAARVNRRSRPGDCFCSAGCRDLPAARGLLPPACCLLHHGVPRKRVECEWDEEEQEAAGGILKHHINREMRGKRGRVGERERTRTRRVSVRVRVRERVRERAREQGK